MRSGTARIDRDGVTTLTDERAEIIDLPEAGIPAVAVRDTPGGGSALSSRPVRASSAAVSAGALILCDNLVKIYKVADLEVVALQGLDLLVERGEFIALVGASGSGKSTLMNILGGLDVPSAGRAVVAGHDLGQMGRRERTAYRRNVMGFVWQQTARNLLGYLTARQNVELPMQLGGVERREQERRAADLLARVGLDDRGDHRPDRLSGGEQQRVAIAVALANRPAVLFADEPTGELDSVTAHQVFELLQTVNHELGVTIVVVTHDPLVSEQVSRTIAIRDGRTSTETLRRRAQAEGGDHHVISEEFAVLDRAGRLQLPRAHVEALGLERRVRLALEPDHISVWPHRERAAEGGAAPDGAAPDRSGDPAS
jgi:ABC-type lipoprotein export system ATPase subunit